LIPNSYAKLIDTVGKWVELSNNLFGNSSLEHSAVMLGKSGSEFGGVGTTAGDESVTIKLDSHEIGPATMTNCRHCTAAWAEAQKLVLPEPDEAHEADIKNHIDSGTLFMIQDQDEGMANE